MKKFFLMTLLAAFGLASLPAFAHDKEVSSIEKHNEETRSDSNDEKSDCGYKH